MGIFDALTTAVAGLQAQSFALQNISGNIANSQTTAYKETDTSFQDLVSQTSLNQQTATGVIASSVPTNTVQGTIQSASVATDMAINGNGLFVVAQPTGFTDNQPVFSGISDYTRRGDFQMNANGYLVNGAGYYLMGIPVDSSTGNPLGSVPQVLQFNQNFVPAQPTTTITYQANLPATPATLLNGANFEANPVAGASIPAQITGSGATLSPDTPAVGTGSVSGLTNATVIAPNLTFTVSDGTNTTTFNSGAGGSTVGALIAAINSGAPGNAAVSAALNAGGNIVLTSTAAGALAATQTITVGGTDAAALGFGAGQDVFNPTNLLTQGAVSQGQILTVTESGVGGGTQTITFGTGPGQVSTLAQLQTALNALSTNVTGNVNAANGDVTLTASGPNATTETLTLGGAPASGWSKFGINNLTAFPANGTVIGNDVSTFDSESVAGGSITAYDSTGNPVNVDFRWAKISSIAHGGADAWQLFYQTSTSASGTQAAWQNVGTTFTFNSSGQLSPPISTVSLSNLTVNGDTLGTVQLQLGANGLTQFANTSGTVQVGQFQQNGYAAGQLESVAVDSQNRVTGTFSNGQTVPLAEVTLASFNGENALQALDGGAYAATPDSGPPNFSATGTIVGSSLEASNVDIATQFSQLIVAQQAYSANAKVMSTANLMIQALLQSVQ